MFFTNHFIIFPFLNLYILPDKGKLFKTLCWPNFSTSIKPIEFQFIYRVNLPFCFRVKLFCFFEIMGFLFLLNNFCDFYLYTYEVRFRPPRTAGATGV